MYGVLNTVDKIKRYFAFSKEEIKWIAISVLVLGLIVGMNECAFSLDKQCEASHANFDAVRLAFNLLNSIVIVALALLVHEAAHRVYGLDIGFRVEFQPWIYGLVAGVMISIMTYGKLIFITSGGIILHVLETHRLGYFRYNRSNSTIGLTAVMGPYANILLAIMFKALGFLPGGLIHKAMMINILFAVYNMLPIPPLDGAHAFFANRGFYLLTFGSIIGMSLLLTFQSSITLVLIGGIFFAFAFQQLFFRVLEKYI